MIDPQHTATVTYRRHLATAAALTLAALLAGCGGSDEPTPDPTPTAARYAQPQDLVAALETAGINCARYDPTDGAVGAVGRGSCYIGDAEVVVSVYATTADAAEEPERKRQFVGGLIDIIMVVGPNWTTSCDQLADCEMIAEATGGKLNHLPKT